MIRVGLAGDLRGAASVLLSHLWKALPTSFPTPSIHLLLPHLPFSFFSLPSFLLPGINLHVAAFSLCRHSTPLCYAQQHMRFLFSWAVVGTLVGALLRNE